MLKASSIRNAITHIRRGTFKERIRERRLERENANVYIRRREAKLSFSQCGEDLLIDYVFKLRGIVNPTYLDIGAHDPFSLNNTAIFYLRGCRGINIDANADLMARFRHLRPADINICSGISDSDGVKEFFVMHDPTLSTFSEDEAEALRNHGHKLDRVEQVPVRTLNNVMREFHPDGFPDLLTIDVEGHDLSILKTIEFSRAAPKIICVEAAEYSTTGAGARRTELVDFLQNLNYIEYANTNLNAIMVQRAFWTPSA